MTKFFFRTRSLKVSVATTKLKSVLKFWVLVARFEFSQAFIQNDRGVWSAVNPIV